MRLQMATLTAAAFFLTLLPSAGAETAGRVHRFVQPIDAVSFEVSTTEVDLSVSGLVNGQWTEPQPLEVETEFDPLLRETNLVLFPEPVTAIRVFGSTAYEPHPITVSNEPLRYTLAATGTFSAPRIYSRRSWGADDSHLFKGAPNTRSDEPGREPPQERRTIPQRVKDCQEDQRRYPQDFDVEQTVSSYGGRDLRWPRRYSPEIRQIVVHHTAMETQDDHRSGMEKMRALYQYHANSRGWGDIGYHYIIDDDGRIYEGRSGGDFVVGGHTYCNNVGTIGVAMMGNFDKEKPTPEQMRSLKWLLDDLADQYDIRPGATINRRGERMPAIVGHGDLISTDCPGFYVRRTLGQIRSHVVAQNFDGRIVFPTVAADTRVDRSEQRLQERLQERGLSTQNVQELQPIGSTAFTSRPGATVRTMIQFTARKYYQGNERIADVDRSSSRIGIWQKKDGDSQRVRRELILPDRLQPGKTTQIPLRFQMPRSGGTFSVDIGDVTYTFRSEGRRLPQPKTGSTRQTFSTEDRRNVQTTGYRRQRAQAMLQRSQERANRRRSTNNSTVATAAATRTVNRTTSDEQTIRIRLSHSADAVRLATTDNQYTLRQQGNACALYQNNRLLEQGVVRVAPGRDGLVTIESWPTVFNVFRGTIECRVLQNELVLINELSLDNYMAGLGEEPDTEPYEKQKAFAVAARSYAAFYVEADGGDRKFPGQPYDGSDSPANFQLYKGYVFEQKNPRWVRAVRTTASEVLTKNENIVKAAYYSSNDGRTRSPAENGWHNFPHAEVFRSKPDPWCEGQTLRGHGVGMSGCGAYGQAEEGKNYVQILSYYYPGTRITAYE